MLKQNYLKTYKGHSIIAECKVVDDTTNETYYVVTQLGNLLYATFESSYLDYVKGKVKEMPKKLEGEDYYWYNKNNTKFFKFYESTYVAAYKIQKEEYVKEKYADIKKPTGKVKYEIVNKQSKYVMACGPCGEAYEIEFNLPEEGRHVFVNSDDLYGFMELTSSSFFELTKNGEEVSYEIVIEDYENFEQTEESNYYDLFLEMEKFKDGID